MRSTGNLGVQVASGSIVVIGRIGESRARDTVFTTIADSQRRAILRFYYCGRDRDGWGYLDSLCLDGIQPARAGEPDLRVRTSLRSGRLCLEIRSPGGGAPLSYVLQTKPSQTRPEPGRPSAPLRSARRSRARAIAAASALCLALCVLLWPVISVRRPAAKRTASTVAAVEPAPSVVAATPKVKVIDADQVVARPPQPTVPAPDMARQSLPPRVDDGSYEVRWGDTLSGIADRYYGDAFLYWDLAELNGLADPDIIFAGQPLGLLPLDGRALPAQPPGPSRLP